MPRWLKNNQAFLQPDAKDFWLIVASGFESGLVKTAVFQQKVVENETYTIYKLEAEEERPSINTQLTQNGQEIFFLGMPQEPEIHDNILSLTTQWHKEGVPVPVKIFIHLLDGSREIAAQWDGLDIAWEGWRSGDTFWQQHQIPLPAELPVGQYVLRRGLVPPQKWGTLAYPNRRRFCGAGCVGDWPMNLSRRWTAVALLLIVLLAAFLRLWQLDAVPPGLYHDEAYNGLDALSLIQGKTFPQFYEGWELYAQDAHGDNPPTPARFPIFFEGNYGREPFHIYLMALSIWLLGPSPQAIRLVPALAGAVAVVTTFWAAKMLVVEKRDRIETERGWLIPLVPLLAAFFVAILYPAVHFSRFGIRPMLFVPLETITVAFFWHGIGYSSKEKKNQLLFFAGGLFLGLKFCIPTPLLDSFLYCLLFLSQFGFGVSGRH